jgi:hypothetical protein
MTAMDSATTIFDALRAAASNSEGSPVEDFFIEQAFKQGLDRRLQGALAELSILRSNADLYKRTYRSIDGMAIGMQEKFDILLVERALDSSIAPNLKKW